MADGIKPAHGVDLIVKKFNAHGLRPSHRKYVKYAAAQAELTFTFGNGRTGIAQREQFVAQPFYIVAFAHVQCYGRAADCIRRRDALHERFGGCDNCRLPVARERRERRQTPRGYFARERGDIEKLQFARGQIKRVR
ncbi:hypothetical protein SDC9_155411 [bioreactor metagenome]|uniref:Uncharacterized protein n=1 Tax=bioreactor metagenome TaxID=1076179 RepID=A0A645F6N2_9ZZZZ